MTAVPRRPGSFPRPGIKGRSPAGPRPTAPSAGDMLRLRQKSGLGGLGGDKAHGSDARSPTRGRATPGGQHAARERVQYGTKQTLDLLQEGASG